MSRRGGRPVLAAREVRVAAQAKVNLRLRILAREVSGYHQIETLFLRLALSDQVRVRVTTGARSLDVGGMVSLEGIGPTERNLAWRAADAYASATGWPAGCAIELEKHIPLGGGLGGGSADAGAVLRALDAMSPVPLGEPALLTLAAGLGSDVPFLTSGHAYALGWGRGERLLALAAPAERAVELLLPAFGVDTAQAYGWLARARDAMSAAHEPGVASGGGMLDASSLHEWEEIARLAINDFEPVVGDRHPEIARLVRRLRTAGCAPAMLSGSGSSVFGILPSGSAEAASAAALAEAARVDGPVAGARALRTRTAASVAPVEPVG